jgi:hypothetical protein
MCNLSQTSPLCPAVRSSIHMKISTKHWRNSVDRGKINYSEKRLSQCHFFYHESHVQWLGTDQIWPESRLSHGMAKDHKVTILCTTFRMHSFSDTRTSQLMLCKVLPSFYLLRKFRDTVRVFRCRMCDCLWLRVASRNVMLTDKKWVQIHFSNLRTYRTPLCCIDGSL